MREGLTRVKVGFMTECLTDHQKRRSQIRAARLRSRLNHICHRIVGIKKKNGSLFRRKADLRCYWLRTGSVESRAPPIVALVPLPGS
jgi:hypothetical protein